MNFRDRFVHDPCACHGETVIRGTCVPVRSLLAQLADGTGAERILADHPMLGADDLRAVIAFAAATALASPDMDLLTPSDFGALYQALDSDPAQQQVAAVRWSTGLEV
jgi:uncharacterized protein (DUF433 family)